MNTCSNWNHGLVTFSERVNLCSISCLFLTNKLVWMGDPFSWRFSFGSLRKTPIWSSVVGLLLKWNPRTSVAVAKETLHKSALPPTGQIMKSMSLFILTWLRVHILAEYLLTYFNMSFHINAWNLKFKLIVSWTREKYVSPDFSRSSWKGHIRRDKPLFELCLHVDSHTNTLVLQGLVFGTLKYQTFIRSE